MTSVLVLAALGLSPVTAAQAEPAPVSSSVTGIDEASFTPAVIPAGTAHNTLRVRWVAPRDMVDGSVTVIVPMRDWQTPLHAQAGLQVDSYLTIARGAVIVRSDDGQCSSTSIASRPESGQPDVSGADLLHGWLLTANDVTCAAGQYLDFRIVNVRAPNRPGTYRIAVNGPPGDNEELPVRVVPTPDVTLHVSAPNPVSHGATVPVRVTAMRNGAVAPDYRGAVSLYGIRGSCADAEGVALMHKFTGKDAGTAVIDVAIVATHRLVARDLAHRAVPGRSNWIHFSGPFSGGGACPTSYH